VSYVQRARQIATVKRDAEPLRRRAYCTCYLNSRRPKPVQQHLVDIKPKGGRAKCPQLDAAIAACKKHKAKLIVAKLDRRRSNTPQMSSASQPGSRIGIDLGGFKIEGILMDSSAKELARYRISTPSDDYAATIAAIRKITTQLMQGITSETKIGIGVPGSISPVTRLIQNANSRWLNGHPLDFDLEVAIGLPVRLANDANCFALSEAIDGAAQNARIVFGAILGTGCGGGIVVDGKLLNGPRSIAGEWGHNPLPWATAEEYPGPQCWCGRKGCLETWLSGPGMAADHTRTTGETLTPLEISARAKQGSKLARATLTRYVHRLARGLAHVVNILDPDVIVLGGGLSQLSHLYGELPLLIGPHIFADRGSAVIRPPKWGSASGVRGAARLWDLPGSSFRRLGEWH
jgi:fructokinase